MSFKYFDSHTHLHLGELAEDRVGVLQRMNEVSVGAVTVGVDLASSKEAVKFANENNVYATIGQHPSDNHLEVFDAEVYRALASDPRVVAIGECGLDYFRVEVGKEEEERARQKEIFKKQIVFAKEIGKPLMIHCRSAHEDMIAMLTEAKHPAIIHFFTGSVEEAKQYIDLGCFLSLSGVVTFAPMYEELVRFIRVDRILVETDAPYAAPVPYRGKRNEPSFVTYTLAHIAKLKSMEEEALRLQVLSNVEKAFGIKLIS